MSIILTCHARERMALRGVTSEMVEETIFTPDWTEPSYGDCIEAYKQTPRGLLKVVYRIDGGDHVIVSVIWKE